MTDAPVWGRGVLRRSSAWLGNGNTSDFESEPNIPIVIRTYHGNAGGLPVTGRPQGWQSISKYFAPTPTDSAQGGSIGSFLVNTGTPFTQTQPVTGMEGDAVVQGANVLDNKAVGVAGAVEAQDAGHIDRAICFYAAAKGARDAATTVDEWYGVFIEDPATGSAGVIADKVGVYSKPRIQSEAGAILGSTHAATTAAMRGTTLHVVGNNTAGNPAVKIVKKAGSTDDIFQITDSGAQPIVLVGQGGAVVLKAGGTAHSVGASVGPILALGNIVTPPSANYAGGNGGFFYADGGALFWRGGAGTVTQVAPA